MPFHRTPSQARARWRPARVSIMDVATVGVLAFAVWQFASIRLGAPAPAAPAPVAALADSAPAPVAVADSSGTAATLFDAGSATPLLVFVFRSDCPYCSQQRDDWTRLAVAARARGVDVVALTSEPLTGGVQNYLGDAPVPIRRVGDPGALVRELGVHAVPATILVDASQRIRFQHVGLMLDPVVSELAALLRSPARQTAVRQ